MSTKPSVSQYMENASQESLLFKKIRKSYESEDVKKKIEILSKWTDVPLEHIKSWSYGTNFFKGNIENPIGTVQIPLGIAGPILVKGDCADGSYFIPMATTEGALVLTYDFGMRILRDSSPIKTKVISKSVHISPMFPIVSNEDVKVTRFVDDNYDEIKKIAEQDSKHTKLLKIQKKKVNSNLVLKFSYDTGDAQGLNMINHATFNACKYIEAKTGAFFYHRSHYSGVKHHSLLNEEEGYGRFVKSSAIIKAEALEMLGVTAKQMKDFCDRCIECGSAAGIKSVNVHASNAIAAIFLACGQDAADISSSHVCRSRCEIVNGTELLWECELRNLLVATVGGGVGLGTQSECLKIMDCYGSGKSDQFAELVAATVLAGEFPTAAAVINRTYVDTHNKYGRNKSKKISHESP